MALWEAVSGSKLQRRREALLFNCRREGLFQPVGNVLDKSKLMIYRYIPRHLEVIAHHPQSRMGWLVVTAVLSLGGDQVLLLTHPWLISSGECRCSRT